MSRLCDGCDEEKHDGPCQEGPSAQVIGKFAATGKVGRKWQYAEIKLKPPAGWNAFVEYGYGPSLRIKDGELTIILRREKEKKS